MSDVPIYLDNHSTTKIDPSVLDEMMPYLKNEYGNASSITHAFGDEARDAVERSRSQIANSIGAKPEEIVFTSGATESNNLAIMGLANHSRNKKRRLISVASEHKATLDPLKKLTKKGFEVHLLNPKSDGMIDLNDLERELNDETLLVSIMSANNEIGTLQNLGEISKACSAVGAFFHTDAVQSLGKVPFDLSLHPTDLASFSGHKLHGPKGVGVLYVRSGAPRIRLEPLFYGGGHENGFRSGTLNVPAIVGFGKATEIAMQNQTEIANRTSALRDELFDLLNSRIDGIQLNGPPLDSPNRLPGNLNIQIEGVDGEALAMSTRSVAFSTGSACTSANPEPSHVLQSIGLTEDQAKSSIRLGLSKFTTRDEIVRASEHLSESVQRLRGLN